MHAVRAARPKLSLAVPTSAATAAAAGVKPSIPQLIIPAAASASTRISTLPPASPMTPTARNTALNARAAATLQVPTAASSRPKKAAHKRVTFAQEESVALVSPCPQDYYGDYAKMGREERRWARN